MFTRKTGATPQKGTRKSANRAKTTTLAAIAIIMAAVAIAVPTLLAGCTAEQDNQVVAETSIHAAPDVITDGTEQSQGQSLAQQASFEERGSAFPAADGASNTEQVSIKSHMKTLNDNQWTKENETLIAAQLSCAKIAAQKRQEDALAKAAADRQAQAAALSRDDVSYAQPHPAATSSPSSAAITNTRQAPDTIQILGATIPFIDAYSVTRAPEHGAGVWRGDESTTDGRMCYFVGHNPGDFHNVMLLNPGDTVTVCDTAGATRTYTVHDCFTTLQKGTYADVKDRVEGHGESVVMQTCVGDGVNIRIVVAY